MVLRDILINLEPLVFCFCELYLIIIFPIPYFWNNLECFPKSEKIPYHGVSYHFIFVNDVIADKNVVTKIMNNSTGLQRIELNGFAKSHWQTGYYPFAYGWCLGLC